MVVRDRPNSRAACRMLMPSTCTDRRMRAYTSTLYTSQVSHKTHLSCNVLELNWWWSTFGPPQTAAYAALCGLLLLRRLYLPAGFNEAQLASGLICLERLGCLQISKDLIDLDPLLARVVS